jgi:hypothetical protein
MTVSTKETDAAKINRRSRSSNRAAATDCRPRGKSTLTPFLPHDGERADLAIKRAAGKRLMYRQSHQARFVATGAATPAGATRNIHRKSQNLKS